MQLFFIDMIYYRNVPRGTISIISQDNVSRGTMQNEIERVFHVEQMVKIQKKKSKAMKRALQKR